MRLGRWEIFRRIKPYARESRWLIVVMLLCSAAAVPVSLVNPVFFQILIDDVMRERQIAVFYQVVVGLLAVYLCRLLLGAVELGVSNRLLNRFTLSLRTDIWNTYKRLPLATFEKEKPGNWKMRLIDDVDGLGSFIKDQVVDYLFSLVTVAVTLVLTLRMSPLMTLLCCLTIPLVFLLNAWIGRGTGKVNEDIRGVSQNYTSFTHDALQYGKEIKIQNAEDTFIGRYRAYRKRLAELGYRWIRYWLYAEIFNDFKANYLTKVLVYIIGSFFVIRGRITVGQLILFGEYFSMLFSSLDAVSSRNAQLRTNAPYYSRVFETLSLAREADGENERPLLGEVEAADIRYGYTPEEPVLQDVSLRLEPGGYIALVGHSGCGKTTLAKLLLLLYHPDAGSIRYDGREASELRRRVLYRHTGMVMQDSYLFNMSIRENLLIAREDATEAELLDACGKASIREFVEGLPKGLDTEIGERGVRLSGGQRQRLAIARALLREPRLLLFDEATSSLDKMSEDRVNEAVREAAGQATLLVISHKPSAVLRAERIVVMDDGRVIDAGTHDELRARNGFYRKLAKDEGGIG